MKFTLVFLIFVAAVGCSLCCTDDSWEDFKENYDKQYDTEEEELFRQNIYCENVKMINEHNERFERGETTYTMGVNRFTDWTQDEFSNWVGGRGAFQRH